MKHGTVERMSVRNAWKMYWHSMDLYSWSWSVAGIQYCKNVETVLLIQH